MMFNHAISFVCYMYESVGRRDLVSCAAQLSETVEKVERTSVDAWAPRGAQLFVLL